VATPDSRPETEEYMASLWSEIIGVATVNGSDRFLDVGGNSLTLNVIVNRVRSERGVSLDPQLFFDDERSSLESVARELDALLGRPPATREL
jgi:hypothetical protein